MRYFVRGRSSCTANGKACLALFEDAEIKRRERAEWARTRKRGDPNALPREIRDARLSGVAFDRDEHTAGISAIGIAYQDWHGDACAISVPTPPPASARK